jgi:demethylmenaquinone methyltransferase / 2-methoxy-6-polyprenyl-1,4-benzoquinol methylase
MSSAVSRMFASIAGRYDMANDIMSLGIHRLWRRELLKRCRLAPGMRALDCATGTGDLALLLKRRVGPGGVVTAVDFCEPMLELARRKAQRQGLGVEFSTADVLDLPYNDGAFDAATIAFGVRNIAPPIKAIASMARVVKPGGRVLVLEFGLPRNAAWRWLYVNYSRYVIPRVGGLLTGNRNAYTYLHNTSTTFPSGEEFARLMRQTGRFTRVEAVALTGGVAYVYVGDVA